MNGNGTRPAERLLMCLNVVDEVCQPSGHRWHFTVCGWPAIVLKLGHIDAFISLEKEKSILGNVNFNGLEFYLAVGDIKLSFCEVGTTFALTVLDSDVVVCGFVIGPIARTLFAPLLQIGQHHQCGDALF